MEEHIQEYRNNLNGEILHLILGLRKRIFYNGFDFVVTLIFDLHHKNDM